MGRSVKRFFLEGASSLLRWRFPLSVVRFLLFRN
jgi:hypothetical protein